MRNVVLALCLGLASSGCDARSELRNGASGVSASANRDERKLRLLTISTERLEFGAMAPKSSHEQALWLSNAGSVSLTIASVKSNCDCLSLHLKHTTLEPGERLQALARLDFAKEPDFTGSLMSTLTLVVGGNGERETVEIQVLADVIEK